MTTWVVLRTGLLHYKSVLFLLTSTGIFVFTAYQYLVVRPSLQRDLDILGQGYMSDWTAVLADPDNNVCDGPAGGLIDRDAPVQSTGRDLTHFEYTWDATSIYLFTERVGPPQAEFTFRALVN